MERIIESSTEAIIKQCMLSYKAQASSTQLLSQLFTLVKGDGKDHEENYANDRKNIYVSVSDINVIVNGGNTVKFMPNDYILTIINENKELYGYILAYLKLACKFVENANSLLEIEIPLFDNYKTKTIYLKEVYECIINMEELIMD